MADICKELHPHLVEAMEAGIGLLELARAPGDLFL
jgi:hypothetical protein